MILWAIADPQNDRLSNQEIILIMIKEGLAVIYTRLVICRHNTEISCLSKIRCKVNLLMFNCMSRHLVDIWGSFLDICSHSRDVLGRSATLRPATGRIEPVSSRRAAIHHTVCPVRDTWSRNRRRHSCWAKK